MGPWWGVSVLVVFVLSYIWMVSLLEMDLVERETWFWYGDAGDSSLVFILGRKGQCER